MNMRRLRTLVFPLAAIAMVAVALVDTAPYRAALKELEQEVAVRDLGKAMKDTEADVKSVLACNSTLRKDNLNTNELEKTPEWRTCLLAALPGVKTAEGALVASLTATMWILEHPEDDGIKTAALAAVARGRTALLSNKGISDGVDKVADAHDRSRIMRLLHRQYGSDRGFASLATQLDQAEYGLLMPEVQRRQEQWRVEATVLSRAS